MVLCVSVAWKHVETKVRFSRIQNQADLGQKGVVDSDVQHTLRARVLRILEPFGIGFDVFYQLRVIGTTYYTSIM